MQQVLLYNHSRSDIFAIDGLHALGFDRWILCNLEALTWLVGGAGRAGLGMGEVVVQ